VIAPTMPGMITPESHAERSAALNRLFACQGEPRGGVERRSAAIRSIVRGVLEAALSDPDSTPASWERIARQGFPLRDAVGVPDRFISQAFTDAVTDAASYSETGMIEAGVSITEHMQTQVMQPGVEQVVQEGVKV
jgi:hypothetical protein